MSSTERPKRRRKLVVYSKLSNPSEFKKLRDRWLRTTSFLELPEFKTRDFTPRDFLNPLILGACTNMSLSSSALLVRSWNQPAPSSETTLRQCRTIGASKMQTLVNQELEHQYRSLPATIRRNFSRSGVVLVDFHADPYYGQADNPYVTTIPKKHGTIRAYTYLTADVYTKKGCQTIAVLPRTPGESISTLFGDLLARIELIIRPKLLLMDGEFVNVGVIKLLAEKSIPWIGRKSMTPRVRPLVLAYQLTDHWEEQAQFQQITLLAKDKKATTPVLVTVQPTPSGIKALAMSPLLNLTPAEAIGWYKKRFGIETGYRDKHIFQARTSAKRLEVRLLVLVLAMILWNLWQAYLLKACPKHWSNITRTGRLRRQIRVIRLFLLLDWLLVDMAAELRR